MCDHHMEDSFGVGLELLKTTSFLPDWVFDFLVAIFVAETESFCFFEAL